MPTTPLKHSPNQIKMLCPAAPNNNLPAQPTAALTPAVRRIMRSLLSINKTFLICPIAAAMDFFKGGEQYATQEDFPNGYIPLDVARAALDAQGIVEFLDDSTFGWPSEKMTAALAKLTPDEIAQLQAAVRDGLRYYA